MCDFAYGDFQLCDTLSAATFAYKILLVLDVVLILVLLWKARHVLARKINSDESFATRAKGIVKILARNLLGGAAAVAFCVVRLNHGAIGHNFLVSLLYALRWITFWITAEYYTELLGRQLGFGPTRYLVTRGKAAGRLGQLSAVRKLAAVCATAGENSRTFFR
jgi:hypothetical protein